MEDGLTEGEKFTAKRLRGKKSSRTDRSAVRKGNSKLQSSGDERR